MEGLCVGTLYSVQFLTNFSIFEHFSAHLKMHDYLKILHKCSSKYLFITFSFTKVFKSSLFLYTDGNLCLPHIKAQTGPSICIQIKTKKVVSALPSSQ